MSRMYPFQKAISFVKLPCSSDLAYEFLWLEKKQLKQHESRRAYRSLSYRYLRQGPCRLRRWTNDCSFANRRHPNICKKDVWPKNMFFAFGSDTLTVEYCVGILEKKGTFSWSWFKLSAIVTSDGNKNVWNKTAFQDSLNRVLKTKF